MSFSSVDLEGRESTILDEGGVPVKGLDNGGVETVLLMGGCEAHVVGIGWEAKSTGSLEKKKKCTSQNVDHQGFETTTCSDLSPGFGASAGR